MICPADRHTPAFNLIDLEVACYKEKSNSDMSLVVWKHWLWGQAAGSSWKNDEQLTEAEKLMKQLLLKSG